MRISGALAIAAAVCGGLAQKPGLNNTHYPLLNNTVNPLLNNTQKPPEINKPAAWPGLFMLDGLNHLPAPTALITPWTNGNIPQGCRDRILIEKADPRQFNAFDVHLSDCDIPWVICAQNNVTVPLNEVVDAFARVPIGMRQFMSEVVQFARGGGAGCNYKVVAVFGDSAKHTPVFIHEASHCVDGANGMGLKSSDKTWRDAYNNDTHVADNYAQKNHIENFAQYAGLIIYNRVTNKTLETFKEYPWIAHQIKTMSKAGDSTQDWGSRIFDVNVTGKKCGRRWESSPPVNSATGALVANLTWTGHLPPRNHSIIIEKTSQLDMSLAAEGVGETRCLFAD